jgi:hypothetical protein
MNATRPLVVFGFGAAMGIALMVELAPPRRHEPPVATRESRCSPPRQVPGGPEKAAPGEEGCSHCGGAGAESTVPPSANYPLEACVVSGEKLGMMGPPVVVVDGDVEVQLCCGGCIVEFQKESDRYVALMSRAKTGATPGDTR